MSFQHYLLGTLDRQTCKDVSVEEAHTYEFMQFKYDGIWACVNMDPLNEKHLVVTSRNGNVKAILNAGKFPRDTVVVGEFMYGTQWSQHPERSGRLFCFDLLALRGEYYGDKPYSERYAALKELLAWVDLPRLDFVGSYHSGNIKRVLQQMHITRAYEGFVVRNWNQPYSADIGRYKLDIEDDFVVMGVNPGEGKHEGRMGSLVVGQYIGDALAEVMTVGGGFSDAQREMIAAIPHKFIGKVIRVTGKARFASGAFRHPNFVCFREDKSPKECIFTKQFTSQTEE